MWLFLASLGMLFAASMAAYVIIRAINPAGPPLGSMDLPAGLWVSTALILASSYTIHRALENIRHERQTRFRQALVVTLLLSVAFLLVQTPSMMQVFRDHRAGYAAFEATDQELPLIGSDLPRDPETGGPLIASEPVRTAMPVQGLVFFLILLHALHVLGGIGPLFVVTLRAHAHRYDHEHYAPVRYVTMYWHFLDGVWVVMFMVLLAAA